MRSNNVICCGIKMIIQEDLLLIGILTETNQFISLICPEMINNNNYDLPIIDKYDIGVREIQKDTIMDNNNNNNNDNECLLPFSQNWLNKRNILKKTSIHGIDSSRPISKVRIIN